MALVKYGPVVSDVRGSIGGTVFSRSRAGAFARIRTKPVFTPTAERDRYQSIMAWVYGYWHDTLTNAQRIAWNTLGDNTDFTNALGDTYHPSGYNLFLRTNALARRILEATVVVAPGAATGAHYPITYTAAAGPVVKAEMEDAPAVQHLILFWLSLPQPFTVYSYTGPFFRFAGLDANTLHSGPQTIFSAVQIQNNRRYFIRDRGWYSLGPVTAPYYQHVDVAL